jgi:ABC-type dipeptide/oligopeptide/nickel transport system ATPase component
VAAPLDDGAFLPRMLLSSCVLPTHLGPKMAEDSSSPTNAIPSSDDDLIVGGAKIAQFEVTGLFGRPLNHSIQFPPQPTSTNDPAILILAGPNGCGKTTILRMIDGMLQLDFDIFRKMPFATARLSLSTGEQLTVEPRSDKDFPLFVRFNEFAAQLSKDKRGYSPEQSRAIAIFRNAALPIFRNIGFQLLDIHRSLALRQTTAEYMLNSLAAHRPDLDPFYAAALRREHRRPEESAELALRVKNFIRDAQVNYRRFFVADQLELLPRILSSLTGTRQLSASRSELAAKVAAIKARSPVMARIGLQTDDTDLDTLAELLAQNSQYTDNASLAVLVTYVAMQETRNQTRELIAKRLLSFEDIMDDFLVGKTVRVDPRVGLQIQAQTGNLNETDLSSGEYHFLYMMVSALLSQRSGSIIAIDEPELSLHVTWQRRVISALARCASGASPLFLFATHSAAISAEHSDRVKVLAVEE